jgi:hypothetical protein
MVPRARWAAGVICICLVALALAPAASGAGGKVSETSPAIDPPPPTEQVVGVFADSTGSLGVYWDQARSQFALVYSSSTPLPSASALASLGVATRVETTIVTASDIATAKAGLRALYVAGALGGKDWTVGFDAQHGVVVVSGADAATVSSILGPLGPKGQFQVQAGLGSRLDRLADSPPFWGGNQILDYEPPWVNTCSGGFAVQRSYQKFFLTAGHCFQAGYTVTTPPGLTVGTVAIRAAFPQRDMELISGGTYGGEIYTGTRYGSGIFVNGTGANPVAGVTYCTGGSKSFEKCDKVALQNNVQGCWSDGCTDQLTSFTNGAELISGDSGGPYYYRANGLAYARGIIIGQINGTGYAQEWDEIQSWFNVTPCHLNPC